MEQETKEEQVEKTSAPEESSATASEATAAAPAKSPYKGFWAKVDNFFGISRSGSKYKTEIIAGLTTFMAMVYILMVNAGMFSESWMGISYGAAYIATAIGAIVGTLLMAFLAKMPLAQASGMGVNAFIVYTLILGNTGLTYANAMVFTLIDGAIFVLLTVTGLRKKIFKAIPRTVRHAITVGIGLFIAFIGMQNADIIVNNDNTLVSFVSFNVLNNFSYGALIAPFVALLGVVVIAVLTKKNIKGAILWGVLGSAVAYYALAGLGCAWSDETCKAVFTGITVDNPFNAFADWGTQSVGKVFTEGFNFSNYLGDAPGAQEISGLIVLLITTALSLCMIDLFDTLGTVYGACAKGGLLDENGIPLNMNKMMLSDAIATCAGAVAGTSTVTTFVESSSGVAAGGKTGFTALVTGLCFIVAMFLSPIAKLIPSCATATALIWVGVLMMSAVTTIDWNDAADAIVGFMTFIVMVLGYSISKGIGAGIITFIIVKLCTGKVKDISVVTWVIGALFVATFLVSSM
ncbi:MAG: NCS2 family permease [Candidatus Coproplasma sp.]